MNEVEQLKSQILALRSVVIAIYSLHLDRQLIDSRASHILDQLVAHGQLAGKTERLALEQLLAELHSYGFGL